jgi:hypothetical protein
LRALRHALAHRPEAGLLLTAGCAGIVIVTLVGRSVVLHPLRAAVGLNPASDFQVMTWSLRWWPFALSHGLNPLHTHLLWPPEGFSTLWMTTIPALSLLASPLTLTAGPLVAYNVLMLLAPVFAAGAAYLLCRELTDRAGPSLVGGLVFGLSPYMLGHTLSQHLDLAFVAPLPLLALLVVRLHRGRTSARRFVLFYSALLLLLLGVSFELFLDTALLTALGFALALLGRQERLVALRIGPLVAFAYALCLPLLVAIAVVALRSPHLPLQYPPADYSTDLLNVVVPTPTTLAGTSSAARNLTQHFVSNIGEKDGYVGIPLLLIAILAAYRERARGALFIGALALAAFTLSLGPTLTIGGRSLLGLPFSTARLPLLSSALPARLSVFTALGCACLCALWLARPGFGRLRILAAVAVLLSLSPNFFAPSRLPGAWARSDELGWSTRHVPLGFVRQSGDARLIRSHSAVLVLPAGSSTDSGYWQAVDEMRFALAAPVTPFVPPRLAAVPIVRGIVEDVPPVLAAPRMRAFLSSHGVSAVFVARNAKEQWHEIVARATASTPIPFREGELYRVPQALQPLRTSSARIEARPSTDTVSPGCRQAPLQAAFVWLRFDGREARLETQLLAHGRLTKRVPLSSPSGEADMPRVAMDRCGHVSIVFTEWRNGHDDLRVATWAKGRWNVATLDERNQPIWSPRIVIIPGGTTVATWVDEDAPQRTVRTSALGPLGQWEHAITLERADGLGSGGDLATSHRTLVFAWRDQVASESRIRVARYTPTGWKPPLTLASSLSVLDDISIDQSADIVVRWNEETPTERVTRRFAAQLHGSTWKLISARGPTLTRQRGLPADAHGTAMDVLNERPELSVTSSRKRRAKSGSAPFP